MTFMWQNFTSESGDIDVIPRFEEHTFGSGCKCQPTVEVIGAYLLTIHNAFDKREIIEQAIAIMNEDVEQKGL